MTAESLRALDLTLAALEAAADPALRRVGAGLRSWLSARDGRSLESSLGVQARGRELWRHTQRRALLRLAAELLAPGAEPWQQAGAIALRCAQLHRRRRGDLADELLHRYAALGRPPTHDRAYRSLAKFTQNLPVAACQDDPVSRTDDQLNAILERLDRASAAVIALEAALGVASLHPCHARARALLLERRDEVQREIRQRRSFNGQ